MSAISTWVLSIAGISILSVLVDLFLPEGETDSHIKTVFNFVIILVIIAPLPTLFKTNINVGDYLGSNDIVIQEDFVYQLNKNKINNLEKSIEKSLNNKGMTQIEIYISADIFTTSMKIESVYVDLSNLVIKPDNKHIDIQKEVVLIVKTYINIEKEKIIFGT